jgi:ATP synthase protein I
MGIAGADARLLIRSAVPTAIAGAVALVTGALVSGGRGALGALLAIVVVAVFFTASVVIVGWVSRVKPAAMMPAALGVFLAKILLLLLLIAALKGTTVLDTKVFGFAAIGCVLVWTGGQVASLARRMPYVEPVPSVDPPPETGSAGRDPGAGPAAMAGPAPDAAPGEHTVNTGGDR